MNNLIVPEPVYPPQEDSHLLCHVIHAYKPEGTVLDMGTGSGIAALAAAETAASVTAVDINPEACTAARENMERNGYADTVTVTQSDLFTAVTSVFDMILFNAPYIPVEEDVAGSEAWAGGETGRDVIKPFLADATEYLAPKGVILLVLSSRTGLDETMVLGQENGFTAEIVAEEKQPWETLYVLAFHREEQE